MTQVTEHNSLIERAEQMSARMPASHTIESRPRCRLHVRAVQERVEDNVRAARRQAGDFFTAHLIDRNPASFGFSAFVAAALVHKPFQIGGRRGAAFDREIQTRFGKERGHEQVGINDRVLGNDFVDAPTPHDQASLIRIDRANPDRARIDIEHPADNRRARRQPGLFGHRAV